MISGSYATMEWTPVIPVHGGRLVLGTWQGIQLAEHRDHGGPRRLVLTLHGDTADG